MKREHDLINKNVKYICFIKYLFNLWWKMDLIVKYLLILSPRFSFAL